MVRVSENMFRYAQRENVTSLVLSEQEAASCSLLAEHETMMVELTVGVNVPVCYCRILHFCREFWR